MKKQNLILKKSLSFILSFILIFSFGINVYASEEKLITSPDFRDVAPIGECECMALAAEYDTGGEDSVTVGSRFYELIFGKKQARQKTEDIKLCPGGDAFGVKICGSGVTVTKIVTDLSSGALCVDDRILSIDGKEISTISDVKEILNASGGKELSFEIQRGGKTIHLEILPKSAAGEYHLGVLLSDGASGIGTITYYDPKTMNFGGLGHGICSRDGGEILKMTEGKVTGVILAGPKRGEPSRPGELRGVLTDKTNGSVYSNTECGVFGKLNAPPESAENKALPLAKKEEVKCGEATIISTVKSGEKAEYKIEIRDVVYSSEGTKSFKIKVTDETLIALTGGIVRGMSGSPIIQNGKLVGAVTHVLVANPTEGYGIFIENMLNAAQNQAQPKAA